MATLTQRVACLEMEVRTLEENAAAAELSSSTAVGSIKAEILKLQLHVEFLQRREATIAVPRLSPNVFGIAASHSTTDEYAIEASLSSRIAEVERRLQDMPLDSNYKRACEIEAALTARVLDVERNLQYVVATLQFYDESEHRPTRFGTGCDITTASKYNGAREIDAALTPRVERDSQKVGVTPKPYEEQPGYDPICEKMESPRACKNHSKSQSVHNENKDAMPDAYIEIAFESRLGALEEAHSQTADMLRQLHQTLQAQQQAEPEVMINDSCAVEDQRWPQRSQSRQNIEPGSSRASTCVDEIARREESAPLETSLWELGLAVGHHTLSEDVMACLLLMMLIGINAVVCIILINEFSKDTVEIDDANMWRMNVGHWQGFATSEGKSMVEQVCNYDMSVVNSASQMRQFVEADSYTSKLFGLHLGSTLCMWCILIFFFLIWEELQKSLDRIWSVLHLQRGRSSRMLQDSDGFILKTLSIPRLCATLVLCGMRMAVAVVFLYSGSLWLIFTADTQDLILNSVALVFVLDIDDLLYRIACPSSVKLIVEALQPLPKPSLGPLHIPSRAIGTISASLLCMGLLGEIWLWPQLDKVTDLRDALCGGDTGFITGVHVATGVVYSYHHGGGRLANASMLMETVNRELREGTNKDNHIEPLSYADFNAAVNIPLVDMIQTLGPVCNDTTNGAYLAATRDRLGSSAVHVSTCSDLNVAQCMMPPVITRMSCPQTCGCDLPFSSSFTMFGCPWHSCVGPDIERAPCSQNAKRFREARRNLPYFDVDLEVLGILSQWHHFWQGFLMYRAVSVDIPVLDMLSTQGLNRTFVTQMFQIYGCATFLHLQKSFLTVVVNALRQFLCAMQKGEPVNIFRRSLAIFCPITCNCDACICLGSNSINAGSQCGPFCNVNGHRRRHFFPPPSVPACAGLHVLGASVIDNTQCKQNLSSLSTWSNPNGFYSCYPEAYNGKHLYRFVDPANITWEIKWEEWLNFSWAAGILGQRIGLQKTSKWTLSSQDQREAGPCPSPPGHSVPTVPACPFINQQDCHVYNRPPRYICGFPCTNISQSRCDVPRFFSPSSTRFPDGVWFPRNSSNTDFDCAAGAQMTTQILPFSVSSGGSATCQVGYVHIHEQLWHGNATCADSVCRGAAGAIGKASSVAVNVSSQPSGCLLGSLSTNLSLISVMYNKFSQPPLYKTTTPHFLVCIRSSAVQGMC